jgi:hypothetical protein
LNKSSKFIRIFFIANDDKQNSNFLPNKKYISKIFKEYCRAGDALNWEEERLAKSLACYLKWEAIDIYNLLSDQDKIFNPTNYFCFNHIMENCIITGNGGKLCRVINKKANLSKSRNSVFAFSSTTRKCGQPSEGPVKKNKFS